MRRRSLFRRNVGVAATAESIRSAEHAPARRRWVVLALVLVSLVLAVVLAWRPIRAHLQAIAVLKRLSGEPITGAMQRIATEPVTLSDLTISTSAGPIRARLYTPTLHPHAPGMVVLHGVHHLGIDEPRMIAFANAMASCGIRVVTPELPDIKDYHVSEASIPTIGDSVTWFAHETGGPVGVLGLSFSGGLSLVAAANPAYRPSMKFVFAVGSQGAMGRVASYYITNEDPRPNGTRELLPAHEYGPLVLEYEHLEDFVPKRDLTAVREVLRSHLYEDKAMEVAAMEKLTPAQKTEALQLMNSSSEETRALLRATEKKYAVELESVSPEHDLRGLTVPVYLLHGEADNIIPAAETLWMASELRATTLQAALISPVLSHLDMEKAPSAWDEWKLVHFMAQVLEAEEKA